MIDQIKAFFTDSETATSPQTDFADNIPLAAAALLIETATMDGFFDTTEKEKIICLLTKNFDLETDAVEKIIDTVQEKGDNPNQVFSSSQIINKSLDYEERIIIMEMIWEVILVDGDVHDFESSLARRVAGLIHIKDQHNGAAKKRVVERISSLSEDN